MSRARLRQPNRGEQGRDVGRRHVSGDHQPQIVLDREPGQQTWLLEYRADAPTREGDAAVELSV